MRSALRSAIASSVGWRWVVVVPVALDLVASPVVWSNVWIGEFCNGRRLSELDPNLKDEKICRTGSWSKQSKSLFLVLSVMHDRFSDL